MPKKTNHFLEDINQFQLLPLFETGTVFITHEAAVVLENMNILPMVLIARHVSGDWVEMSDENQKTNLNNAEYGGRLFASYNLPDDSEIWIITESDRSKTTIQLPYRS